MLKRASEDRPFDRGAPGLDHVALHAALREQIDRVADGVRERDATSLLYPDRHPYAGGYYATYLEESNGSVVEVVGPERTVLAWGRG